MKDRVKRRERLDAVPPQRRRRKHSPGARACGEGRVKTLPCGIQYPNGIVSAKLPPYNMPYRRARKMWDGKPVPYDGCA